MSARSYIVTVKTKNDTHRLIWDSTKPISLGHPFKFILENYNGKVRLRNLSHEFDRISKSAVQEISQAMIRKGEEIKVEDISLAVKPVIDVKPAFEIYDQSYTSTSAIQIYACMGNWVYQSSPLGEKHEAKLQGRTIFQIYKSGDKIRIDPQTEGLSIVRLDSEGKAQKKEIQKIGQALEFLPQQLNQCTLHFESVVWRFSHALQPEIGAIDLEQKDAEWNWFKKSLTVATSVLVGLLIISFLWPENKKIEEELIPQQYAKIVMQQPVKPAEPAASAAPAASGGPAVPKTVEKAAVVQAFRAKALQSAVSGLLKGGMTTLLAQSDFVAGKTASADARRIFNTKNEALRATGAEVGLAANRNVKVGGIGGGSGAGGGVGYGKGERAGISGQGKSTIAMDTSASDVAEGLTKEQVGEVIHRHMSEVRYCYESSMIRMPDIEGKLLVAFTIGGAGQVKSSSVKQSTLPDPRLDDCIIRRLATWKFPIPKGGIDVSVTYPFIFKTLGR